MNWQTMNWQAFLAWSVLLVAQNASFTWVSRARNSASLRYHWIASVFSNGMWIINQFVIINAFVEIRRTHNVWLAVGASAFYIVCTSTSGVATHAFLMRYVERGDRRIGSGKVRG